MPQDTWEQGLDNVIKQLPALAADAMAETMVAAEGAAKGTTAFRDRTRELRGSIHGEVAAVTATTVDGVLRADAPHAPYVELGTKRHIIRPRFKKALWWPGLPHPVAWARHPGTRPRPYLWPAMWLTVRANVLGQAVAARLRRLLP